MAKGTVVHQFHSGTALGDAVTQEMLRLRAELRAMGYDSEVFAEHVHPDLRREIRNIGAYRADPGQVLIVHHSMGYTAFDQVLALPNSKILRYHNITPAEFFSDPTLQHYARLGQRQLRRLIPHTRVALANSNHSRRELLAAGCTGVHVLPVQAALDAVATDSREARRGSGATDEHGNDWLFVGRVVANKAHHDLIDSFAVYHRTCDPDARLWLVGDTSHVAYVDELLARAKALGVSKQVVLCGKVSADELATRYRSAGLFVCLSEHEGFGVPLLEAMAAGLPVVAYDAAAVAETMGGAGVLLRDKDPALVAAVAKALADDPALRAQVLDVQQARLERYRRFDVRAVLQQVVDEALGAPHPLEVQIQGPFETSYSLAAMNRELALQLAERPGLSVSLYATEGPGDYQPAAADLRRHPRARALWERSTQRPWPDVAIRQLFPPRVHDAPGGLNLLYFGWEESGLPPEWAADFNRHLDGIGVMSSYVGDVLVAAGVRLPVEVVGNGVRPPVLDRPPDLPELADLRPFRFLNIGSAFPRKGLDVLLAAYFDAFSGVDPVSLVLKTFPNPHNDVGQQLAALRANHEDPPDVRWIDRDLPAADVGRLYGIASCYVHTSRGEGFGLPVAEAMLADVPVVAVAQSGTADFCSDDTALTVPYRMEPATTHVSTPGSLWAEPDVGALAKQLQFVVEHAGDPEMRQRTERARRLIEERFSWPAAAERWAGFIDRLGDEALVPLVALVTPWDSRCGIAEYSRHLALGFGDRARWRVFAEESTDLTGGPDVVDVVRCWQDRFSPDLGPLRRELLASEADLVHVQFNFSFFELRALAGLCRAVQDDGRGMVITLHATHEPPADGGPISLGHIAPTLARADLLIVHQPSDVDRLAGYGIEGNVVVIPHGAAVGGLPERAAVREALRLGDRPVVATFGFALPHKGTLELIRALALLRERHPDVVLVALCAVHPDPSSATYLSRCRDEVERLGLHDHVVLVDDFLSELEARSLLAGADVVALPYAPTPESASGALRFVIGSGAAVLTTQLPIFADAAEAIHQVDSNDPSVLADGLGQLLADDERRRLVADRCAAYARSVSWEEVGRQHLGHYRRLIRRRRASGI